MYSSAVFTGVELFALKFYLDSSWRQKTRDTGLLDGEDHIPLRSLVLTQYRSVTVRQADGQTDGYNAVAHTALANGCFLNKFIGYTSLFHMTFV